MSDDTSRIEQREQDAGMEDTMSGRQGSRPRSFKRSRHARLSLRHSEAQGHGSINEDIDSNKGEDEPVKLENDATGNGGNDDGFELVTFDVVKDDNTAGRYRWRAEEVT
jgi:hypothetical protein